MLNNVSFEVLDYSLATVVGNQVIYFGSDSDIASSVLEKEENSSHLKLVTKFEGI